MNLIFVYNADSGAVNAIVGSIHKAVSPASYNCQLCAITYGTLKENKLWKEFRKNSGLEMTFYHRDEFLKAFASKWLPKYNFPIILSEDQGQLEVFVSDEDINTIDSAEDLIREINERLEKY